MERIEKRTRTYWTVKGCDGEYSTKEEAEEAYKRKVYHSAETMRNAQSRVRVAKKGCSAKFRMYKDYLLSMKGLKMRLEDWCGGTAVSWEARGRTSITHLNEPVRLVRTFPERFLKQLVRLALKHGLAEQIEVLRTEKKRYYDAVAFLNEIRAMRYGTRKSEGGK